MSVRGEELVDLARRRGLILAIVHNFQFTSCARKLTRDLRTGALGRVRSIMAVQLGNPRRRLPVWYEKLPLGLFYDESPHFFYMLEKAAPGPLSFVRCDVFPSTRGLVTPACVTAHYACVAGDGAMIPVTMSMNFESPVSEWHLIVLAEEGLADLDIFRDIYTRLPNDGLHTTATVVRTSFLATAQHWAQHLTRGALHLTGRLRYGNDEIFARFARAVQSGVPPEGIGAIDALAVLRRQHEVLTRHEVLMSPTA